MEWTVSSFLLANFILIVASILQMATGVSVGMIIVPFLAMISYTLIPAPIAFASLTLTVMMAYKGIEHIDITNVPQVTLGMIAGIFVALYIFKNTHVEHLGVIFGMFILISVFISWKVSTFKLGATINYSGGFLAGIMGAMAAVGGQILALIFQNHPLESIKSTLAFLYTIFTIVMLVIFYLFDEFSLAQMISGFYMMPGFIIGLLIAPMFTKYFNPKYAKPVVLGMATFGALALIFRSLI
ncbi:MAG: Probable membrane transporter protein [uncultured Sulfurovum sp.]|uniref:Probable membrane transporter protein n=1 Tax=uncultured Sulfurovum sp. TaxID=269237 RepID=A0A6S6SPH5_9BACT|nr:MAG: Probable membrane transporter protein [uncultured Sulfurovum sp.]